MTILILIFGRERDALPTMPVSDSTKLGGFDSVDPGAAGVPRVLTGMAAEYWMTTGIQQTMHWQCWFGI